MANTSRRSYDGIVTRVAILVGFLLCIAGSAGASTSGLRGVVTRGPTRPICTPELPCTQPAKGITLTFARNGRIAGRATTGDDGHYRIALHAGTYTVRTGAVSVGIGSLKPTIAIVPTGRVAIRNFAIDTGIR